MTGGMDLIHNGEEYLENHYYPLPEEGLNYHGVNENGIDVDWMSTGSGYATQYCDPIAERRYRYVAERFDEHVT